MSKFNDSLTPQQFEVLLTEQIWNVIRGYVVDNLYMAAADGADAVSFRTNTEHMMDIWVKDQLSRSACTIASETLTDEFFRSLDFEDTDGVFSKLKEKIMDICKRKCIWDPRAEFRVMAVQELKLRDDVIKNEREWVDTAQFMLTHLELEQTRALQKYTCVVHVYMYKWARLFLLARLCDGWIDSRWIDG